MNARPDPIWTDPICDTERGENIRIISARKATKKERKQYEEMA
jgi:uncharacterized DUF497 family protein